MTTPHDITAMSAAEISIALEQLLFGDDLTAKTDEQIDRATLNAPFIRNHGGMLQYSATEKLWFCQFEFDNKHYQYRWPYKSHPYLWNNRHGEPWQRAIEQYVAAYRRPARDLAGTADGMFAVLEKMAELQWVCSIAFGKPGASVGFSGNGLGERTAMEITLPLAVARAALMALTNKKGEP